MHKPIAIEKRFDFTKKLFRTYLMLAKPGIIMGNSITAYAGFALASKGSIKAQLLITTLIGLALIIASACVFNNYIDRYADEKMIRTKHRALVKGSISIKNAIRFALILGLLGVVVLSFFTNPLALWAALIGFSVYVFLYSFWKYRTSYGTLIGSIAGAMPPLVGYCAVSGCVDLGALLLFFIVVFWQMPHFFAIAMNRLNDYAAASIPVLPIAKGIYATKIQMLIYTVSFAIAAILPTVYNLTGYAYLIIALIVGSVWLALCIKGFWMKNNKVWARQMFLFSLVAITLLSLFIVVDVQ